MRSVGKVKWFNPGKGYGFIVSDDAAIRGEDVFVHLSALRGLKIYQGDTVKFDADKCDKGYRAQAVEVIEAT